MFSFQSKPSKAFLWLKLQEDNLLMETKGPILHSSVVQGANAGANVCLFVF